MNDIDRQRIAGVKALPALGSTWHEGRWVKPSARASRYFRKPTRSMPSVDRADQLMSCTENSSDENELIAIGERSKLTSLSVGPRERSRAEKAEWAQMMQGAKQATVVGLVLLGLFHVLAARESEVPILMASLILWWAWLADSR